MNEVKNEVVFPEVGKIYDCYDDGKISTSRRYSVYIYQIMTYDIGMQDNELAMLWNINKKEYDHLFGETTSHFVIGISHQTTCPKIEVFVITKWNGWFGLGELKYSEIDGYYSDCWRCSGLLDVEGKFKDYSRFD